MSFKKKIRGLFVSISICIVCVASPIFSLAFGPSDSDLLNGIDVSEWQGNIDFRAVRNEGIDIVYIRSSLGETFKDPNFEQNYTRAKAAGIKVGFYHYVTAKSTAEAVREAQFFISVVSGKTHDCRLAMDFEQFEGLDAAEINNISKSFLEELQRLSGKTPVIYTNTYTAQNILDASLNSYPLWIAEYGVSEPGNNGKWDVWSGWQYSSTGRVGGIATDVDRDYFTKDIYVEDTSAIPNPGRPVAPTPDEVTIVVKKGDTLWEIAQKYHTTVTSIARLNGISNVNLIFPGQKLRVLVGTTGNETEAEVIRYTVKPGDTLWDIAVRYRTTVSYLVAVNNIKNPSLILPGQVLIIRKADGVIISPATRYYIVRPGDTLWDIAFRNRISVAQIISLNYLKNPDLIFPGQKIKLPAL